MALAMAAWSGLPQDIVQVIISKLYTVDRIRFRAVCKDWFLAASIQIFDPINKQLPWIMYFRFTVSERVCVVFEPFCRQPYIIEDYKKPKSERRFLYVGHRAELYCSRAHACRSGWVLLTVKELRHWTDSVLSYLVYNVLTGKIIELPELTVKNYPPATDAAAFSSLPTCPGCVFFVPGNFEGDRISISSYTVGRGDEDSWKTHNFTCPNASDYSVESVVYMEGEESFYCFSGEELLSFFSVATQEWKPLTTKTSGRCPRPDWWAPDPRNHRYFLEYGGRLVVAFMGWARGYRPSWAKCQIFTFDRKERVWIKMESLEGGALFLGHRRTCLGLPPGRRGDNTTTTTISNRVYYFGEEDAPTFLTYGRSSPQSEEERKEDGLLMDYHNVWDVQHLHDNSKEDDRIWLHNMKEDRIWIHPPLLPCSLSN